MARRRHHEEEGSHEAWAIPYGDLITLLLAFFVVMYAISSVNEGKYRVLSESLVAAFRAPPRSLEPVQVGAPARTPVEARTRDSRTLMPLDTVRKPLDMIERSPELEYMQRAGLTAEDLDAAAALIESIDDELVEALDDLVDRDLVRLRRDRFWLEVEINTSLLFASGSAALSSDARPVVRQIGAIVEGLPVRVYVEGHTDELPIQTGAYPSNWELSAARAASVVRLFADMGTAPERMAAVGFGEHQPVADNDTVAGRQANRRVVIVIMAGRERIVSRDVSTNREPAARPSDAVDAPAATP